MDLTNKKRKLSELGTAEDAGTGGSGSMMALRGASSGGSSLSPRETNDGLSSSSTVPMGNSYEVFLSFRGPDTRNNFTDHLYNGLCDAGVDTFRDDEELRQGEKIGPDLSAAIKNSKILIPILSVNYGGSKWCMVELVQIMECKNNNTGQIVLPIFYKVPPADVRYQRGSFGEAFHERERRQRARCSDPTISEKWKEALREVGDLKGREADGFEAQLVKSIVQQVLRELKKTFELVIPEILVGIDHHVKSVMEFVDNNPHATLFVGIHGMGGIGKTTLAKMIYNKISDQFEHRSFIADVRESSKGKGIHYLQNQLIFDILNKKDQVNNNDQGIKLISSKLQRMKVLILLDDVGNDDELKALAGNHNWFSSGSMIIITTRNKSILDNARVKCQYNHKEMDPENSLILFCRHAFRRDSPPGEFKDLTHDVVSTTGGLPLSLEVLGSFLCGKETMVWKGTIKKLRKVPHEKVAKRLRISYEALSYEQKQIFLDIACFFIGADKIIASYMWDACDYFPEEGIEVLKFLSLIKVGDNHQLIMHDQLRDLGREIVREENKMEPGKRSRLWDFKEALKMLKENEGTKKIEAICLGIHSSSGARETTIQYGEVFTGKQFKKLRNLRFLEANGAHFSGDFKKSIRKLKWLQWQHCPSNFEANNFRAEELVVLDLANSQISCTWQGWSFIMMAKELKYLDLTRCDFLSKTSFLSVFEKLEVLILRSCRNIEQIDSSIGKMKSLVRLDLSVCLTLEWLPVEVGKLEALEHLLLSYSGVRQLPDSIGNLQNLQTLDVGHTGIEELPNAIGRLRKLRELNASYCRELRETPESIGNLSSLQRLDLYDCVSLQSMSVLPSSLKSLRIACKNLKLATLSNQTHLKELHLDGCTFLECFWEPPSVPSEESLNAPSELEILKLDGCHLLKILDVSQFNHLRELSVISCNNIQTIRGLDKLEYLESLHISSCPSIKWLKLPNSQRLKRLTVHSCLELVEIRDLGRLVALEEVRISVCNSIERLDLTNSKDLKIFYADCKNLIKIRGLRRKLALEELSISSCRSIKRLDLIKFKGLKKLRVGSCENLSEIQGLHKLEFLKLLDMSRCTSFGRLPALCCFDTLDTLAINYGESRLHNIHGLGRFPSCKSLWIEDYKSLAKDLNLSNFCNLQTLVLSRFQKLRKISGLEKSTSLKSMAILGCSSIKILPDLSSCTNLVSLVVQDCEKLTELRGLEKLEQLIKLDISGCKSLKTIPELPRAKIYLNYELTEWQTGDAIRVLRHYEVESS